MRVHRTGVACERWDRVGAKLLLAHRCAARGPGSKSASTKKKCDQKSRGEAPTVNTIFH